MKSTPRTRIATPEDAQSFSDAGRKLFLQAYEGMILDNEMAEYVASHFNETRQYSELSDPLVTSLLVECNNDIAPRFSKTGHYSGMLAVVSI